MIMPLSIVDQNRKRGRDKSLCCSSTSSGVSSAKGTRPLGSTMNTIAFFICEVKLLRVSLASLPLRTADGNSPTQSQPVRFSSSLP